MAKIFAYDSLSATWAAVPSALNTSEYLAGWWTFERNGSLYATYSGGIFLLYFFIDNKTFQVLFINGIQLLSFQIQYSVPILL